MTKPVPYTHEERVIIIETVVAGLRAGTPLSVICAKEGMPCDDTIRNWADDDEEIARAIARAREVGWDQIAIDALTIADDVTDKDTEQTEWGERPNKEWLMRSKLRVETRLKLLAKWDPKRYGEMIKHAGADGEGPVKIVISEEDAGL
jgi:hypothetical protein